MMHAAIRSTEHTAHDAVQVFSPQWCAVCLQSPRRWLPVRSEIATEIHRLNHVVLPQWTLLADASYVTGRNAAMPGLPSNADELGNR
jgi:hypothetical protein